MRILDAINQVGQSPVTIPLVTLWNFFDLDNFGMAQYFRGLQGDGTQLMFDQKIYHTRLGRRLPAFINLVYRQLYGPIKNRSMLKQLRGRPWILGGQQFAHLLPRRYLSTSIAVTLDLLELDYPDSDSMVASRSSLHSQLGDIRFARHIVTVSEHSKQRIIAHFDIEPDNISVVPPGVHTDRFRPRDDAERRQIRSRLGLADKAFLILYVGSEQRRKNLSPLIKGLGQLTRSMPELMFVKIGTPQSTAGRKRFLLDVQDIADHYRLIETVTEDLLSDWYSAADLFVFPSAGEGFGLPILEAMACATPVITTQCCSIPEITAGTAITVDDPYSAEQWSRAVGDLMHATAFRREVGQRGRQRALKFTWATSRHLFMSVLEHEVYTEA